MTKQCYALVGISLLMIAAGTCSCNVAGEESEATLAPKVETALRQIEEQQTAYNNIQGQITTIDERLTVVETNVITINDQSKTQNNYGIQPHHLIIAYAIYELLKYFVYKPMKRRRAKNA